MQFYNPALTQLNAAEVRRYAGLLKIPHFAEKNIRDACAAALTLIDGRCAWKLYDYKNQTVQSDPPFKTVGNSIVNHLDGCEKIIALAATVGADIEREINRLFMRGDYLNSVLLDAAATVAVECTADALEKHLAGIFSKQGFKLRWRFSPGYADWLLDAQKVLFKISGAEQIGINLTSALMLEPRKSITAIIGLAGSFAEKKNCAACDKKDCPYAKDSQGVVY